MIKKICFSVFILLFLLEIPCAVNAGQVVTDELRAWAKQVIAQEKNIGTIPGEKSVAVLYFLNKTSDIGLNPLEKGIALMLITDLSKVEGISVVERVRLEAIIEELKLSVSGLTSPGTSPRVGKLLQAYWIVGGGISGNSNDLTLHSRVLEIMKAALLGQPTSRGRLAQIFKMEKDILFEIIKLLKVKLKPAEIEELKRPLSTNIDALMAFFRGIDASDRRNYEQAARFYEEAVKKDNHLDIARDALKELRSLGLIQTRSRTTKLLRSLKAQTSLTDKLIPEYPVKRMRSPGEVLQVQPLNGNVNPLSPNLPPDYGATAEPARPAAQPSGRPGIFQGR